MKKAPKDDQQIPQHEGSTAYLQPILEYPCGNPTAYLTAPEEKTLTPILDTGASHCLLPVAHLTAEEVELASRVHLRVANGTLTRALMYQNIIYAKRVPRPLVSVGHVTLSLGLTFHWSNGIPRLILHEEGESYEVLQAALWNALPCITDVQLMAIVEALTLVTLGSRLWTRTDWTKALGVANLPVLDSGAMLQK
eukprot:1556384-Amphidinium_carterae.3